MYFTIVQLITKQPPYLCFEAEEAFPFRRAPGERELRELEFEELKVQRTHKERDDGIATHMGLLRHALRHAVTRTHTPTFRHKERESYHVRENEQHYDTMSNERVKP